MNALTRLIVVGINFFPDFIPGGKVGFALRRGLFLSLLVLAFLGGRNCPARAADSSLPAPLLAQWLSAQTNLQTWSADVLQTRSLKTLTQPVTARGQVWFSAPSRFRWEISEPAPTIAVRQPHQMLVIYPRLKRAERYPLDGAQAGPWRDTLSLLEAGFPRSQNELESRFKTISQTVSNGVCELVLQPKSASARRLMPQIKIAFGTNDLMLRATELEFADGSTMRNEFSNPQINPKLNDDLFEPKLESGYKIVEPAKGASR